MRAVAIVVGLVCSGVGSGVALAAPPGAASMMLDDLALLRTDARTYQVSSYERNGGNYDRGNFLLHRRQRAGAAGRAGTRSHWRR